jgi:hypothetical protein
MQGLEGYHGTPQMHLRQTMHLGDARHGGVTAIPASTKGYFTIEGGTRGGGGRSPS